MTQDKQGNPPTTNFPLPLCLIFLAVGMLIPVIHFRGQISDLEAQNIQLSKENQALQTRVKEQQTLIQGMLMNRD